jgi:hypothetical protein
METTPAGNVLYMPKRRTSGRMSSLERARAHEGMLQAVALANVTMAAIARLRRAAQSVGRKMFSKAKAARSGAIRA